MYTYKYFVPSNYDIFISTCQAYFSSHEPGTILSTPCNGVLQRVRQLIQDYSGKFDHPCIHIDIRSSFEDLKDMQNYIASKGYKLGKDHLYLLVTNADYCLKSRNTTIIDELIEVQYNTRTLSPIFFFETDITSPPHPDLFRESHIFAQIYYYPLSDLQDAEKFLSYCADEWNMNLPKKVAKKMVKICYSHLWLLRHALREYRQNDAIDLDKLIEMPSTQFRLDQIQKAFSKDELSIFNGERGSFSQAKKHLERLGLFKRDRCTIPLLSEYLNKTKPNHKLEWKQGTIFCDGVNIQHSLSRQETHLIKLFLSNANKLVTRDQVADTLWGSASDEKYSNWAIEQLIKRLRGKLTDLGFPATVLQTIRGQGYQFYLTKGSSITPF